MLKPIILTLNATGKELVMNMASQVYSIHYNFLNMILYELMPWHKQSYNSSLLEVNAINREMFKIKRYPCPTPLSHEN